MDVETALQGAHDLQGALLGDVEVAQAGKAAGGAIGGAGVVAGPSGVQVVSADIHVPPAQHVSEKAGTNTVIVIVVGATAAHLMTQYVSLF